MTGLSKLFPKSKRFGGYHLKYLDKNETHAVAILAGAFMMVRKKAIEKSGYLDEQFFMYGEDIDWSYRIASSGYTNYYFPEPIIHYKGESTKKDIKYVTYFYEAMLIFFNKHYPHSNRFFKLVIRFAITACGVMSAFQKIFKPLKILKPLQTLESTFDKSKMSYEQIIRTMDEYSGEKTRFKIYHPEKGITIVPTEVIVDNTI
jgi:GT2 family glycosyltransferase